MTRTLWVVVCGLMVFSLVLAACGPTEIVATPTVSSAQRTASTPAVTEATTTPAATQTAADTGPGKEVTQKSGIEAQSGMPQYGGTLVRATTLIATTGNFDPLQAAIASAGLTLEDLWMGDWSKGPAGGYGTGETDWAHSYDIYSQKQPFLAESVKWSADSAKNEGTIVYQIRQGVHYYKRPDSEASKLVNGREMTADDVVYDLNLRAHDKRSYIYNANPELRAARITKTGPWEVTVKVPLDALIPAITRFTDACQIYPPEIIEKFGIASNDWTVAIGTGPFIPVERVPGSLSRMVRNPDYYFKDPVGPGKGNQLPYLDAITTIEIADESTQQAALRTGKIDHKQDMSRTDYLQMLKQQPALRWVERTSNDGRGTPAFMRMDKPPFNDIRVRRALIMAIDYEMILENLYGGYGQYITYPNADTKGYHNLHLALEEMPPDARELFTYSPEKSKQLLKDAGYPNGFKTSIVLTTTYVDYYSIIKDMLAKVNVELTLDIKDSSVLNSIRNNRTQEGLAYNTTAPVATFYLGIGLQGETQYNLSFIDDPVINSALSEVRLAAVNDINQAMSIYKEKIAKHVLEEAYAIPDVLGYTYTLWWPWLKGYSGERTVGYDDGIWPQFIWYDTALKKSMGF